jgi:aspartate kinase
VPFINFVKGAFKLGMKVWNDIWNGAKQVVQFVIDKVEYLIKRVQDAIGFTDLLYDDHIGKLSLIGAGMRSHPGVSARFFTALADAGVNVEMISTSEIRISVICRDTDLDAAVRAVHDAFELGSEEEEAVVYGGTGR